MDDPWGSPWADEVRSENTITAPADGLATPRKQELVVEKASRLLDEKIESPWDDTKDDGYGGWAEDVGGKETLVLGGTSDAGTWEQFAGQDVNTVKSDSTASLHARDVDVKVVEESSLEPPSFPGNGMRRSSPDPWATQFPAIVDEEVWKAKRTDGEGKFSEDTGIASIEPELVDFGADDASVPSNESPACEQHLKGGLTSPSPATDKTKANNGTSEVSIQPSDSFEIEHLSSRPSSSLSNTSLESPRTSFDDEFKRPQVPRKVSSKVQELVVHFDSLGKEKEMEAEEVVDPKGIPQNLQRGQDEEMALEADSDDFGEFEEGNSDDETLKEPDSQSQSHSTPTQRSPKADHQTPHTMTGQKSPTSSKPKAKTIGPVEFSLDMSSLEKVFPSSEANFSVEDVFIPDNIPDNSFATAEERKMWYRVSRYGSMRKHNSGDDENYVRANWARSQIRDDTTKIVARWMEEDRTGGQTHLGGTGKTDSIFGWGESKARPVSFSSAFSTKYGKKNPEPETVVPREWPTSLTKNHSSPKSRSSSKSRRRAPSKKASISEDIVGLSKESVATFGWNSPNPKLQASSIELPLSKQQPGSDIIEQTPKYHNVQFDPILSAGAVPDSGQIVSNKPADPRDDPTKSKISVSSKTLAMTKDSKVPELSIAPSLSVKDLSDDDDWGEMVSSPIMSDPPLPAPPRVLGHKKSFSAIVSPSFNITSTINHSNPSKISGSNHKSTMSFDGFAAPQNQGQTVSPMSALDLSVFGAITPHGKPPQPSSKQEKPASPSNIDPWQFADVSFFESSPTTAPPPQPSQPSILKSALKKSQPVLPGHLGPKKAPIPSNQNVSDAKVREIVEGLPDLSYMLRR